MFTLAKNGKATKNTNILDVKVKCYDECGYCNDSGSRVILNIPLAIWSQWIYVSQKMGGREWGAVFWIKDDAITRFKIPRQEVTSTECEFKEELGGNGIVHSHHDMGAFHSSQDDRHARNLYDYSIVLSNGKGYDASRRVKLPCGGIGYARVELCLVDCPEIEMEKIKEKEWAYHREKDWTGGYERELDHGIKDFPCDKCTAHQCDTCQLFNDIHLPCDKCESLKCKTCRFAAAADFGEVLPFCESCEDYDSCNLCAKLAKYLENYPEDRKYFESLYELSK